jgi:rsbT antagonist protein RsbS
MEFVQPMETATIQKLESLLLVSVPRDLMDDQVLWLRRQVLKDVRRHRSQWVLLDFSQVDICDSFYGRFVQSIAHMVKLTGAEVVVCGLQDMVVETLIELGMTLDDIHAVLDLDDALALSRENEHIGKSSLQGVAEGGLGPRSVAEGGAASWRDRGADAFADALFVNGPALSAAPFADFPNLPFTDFPGG